MSIHSQYVTGRKVLILYIIYVFQDANIRSVYSLCSSIPFEELTASLTSVATLSLLVEELMVYPTIAIPYLATILNPAEVAALASVYSLATAVT